ncbi:hypothetical protein [Paenibacillus sp. 1P03SA]|uniref:hypothetical protein n=1 Tax=Paenibacillus sp. 1P03SA TaxID=3132294 RepID=UPI0039A0CEC4
MYGIIVNVMLAIFTGTLIATVIGLAYTGLYMPMFGPPQTSFEIALFVTGAMLTGLVIVGTCGYVKLVKSRKK